MKKKLKKCCVCNRKLFKNQIENKGGGFFCCDDCVQMIEAEFLELKTTGNKIDSTESLFRFLGSVYYEATHEYTSPYPDGY